MKKRLVSFFMRPRNLYIVGMILTFGLSFSEVIRNRQKNFMVFSEATKLFWKGIAPYGDNWTALTTNLDKFVYGPVFNVFFAPFALMPKWLGPFMWNFMNFSLYFLAIFTLPDKFSKETKCKIFLFTLLILSTSLHSFQTNILVAATFLFAYSLLERDKPHWAILLILLSGFIKVYGIFQLGLLLCYPKFWRNAGYVMLGMAFFLLLPMINTQIGNWTDYYGSWFDAVMSHKDGRPHPWHTFYYMQPWGNISFASVYIQISTLFSLMLLFVMNRKRFFSDAFKLQALGILMGWMVLFSNAADTHTHLITMLGFALWYWSRTKRTTTDKIFFYALLVVVMVVPVDLLCPPSLMRFLFGTLSLHLWLMLINWIRMCWLTFGKDYSSRHCERSEAIQRNLLHVTRNALLFQHRDASPLWFLRRGKNRDIPRNDGKRDFYKMLSFFFILLLTLAACTNSSRPGLSDKQLLSLETPERDDTERIVNFSDTIPTGIKYSEERAIDAAVPPVTLDLHSLNIESKKFDPADYYSKVSFVKIKHPRAESGGKFVTTQGISFGSERKVNSLVKLSDKYIFVNDFRMGLFCYDAQGNFLDTIAESSYLKDDPNKSLSGNRKGSGWVTLENEGLVRYFFADIFGYLGEFSVVGDDCLFLTLEDDVFVMNFYNIPTKTRSVDIEKDVPKLNFQNLSPVTVPPKRPFRGGTPVLLSQSSYVMETLNPISMRETFLTTFGIRGDTLCHFQDLVPKVKIQTNYSPGSDLAFSYLLDNQYTIHQQYCDTVFRLTADNRLTPVYILDFGERRMDKRSGLIGNKSGKLTLRNWTESRQFIYIVFIEFVDDSNINLHHRLYHKRDRKLYQIPTPVEDAFPEDIIVENSLPNALPFTLNKINILDNMLYVVYSKTDLQKLMEHPSFSALPENQKARVKQYYDGMNDNELLIMKME